MAASISNFILVATRKLIQVRCRKGFSVSLIHGRGTRIRNTLGFSDEQPYPSRDFTSTSKSTLQLHASLATAVTPGLNSESGVLQRPGIKRLEERQQLDQLAH